MSKHTPTPKRAKFLECEILEAQRDEANRNFFNADAEVWRLEKKLERERAIFVRFFDDVNLILAGSRDTLCGSKWINAASLLEARNRYAKAMEEL